ncbi:hypothetical protein [Kibdelosporangium aridum]|nr:hypothetical protein [Kibdelosporangium aridum]
MPDDNDSGVDAVNERVDAVLAAAWRAIQHQHSAVPDAAVRLSVTSPQAPCGAATWRTAADDGRTPDITIGTEHLRDGAEAVFTALLHDAAHGIAAATIKGKDVAQDGRTHTVRYAVIAQQLGLDAVEIGDRGYAATTMTPTTRTAYAGVIDQLATALAPLRSTSPTFPPVGHSDTVRITVYQRSAGDGSCWIGVHVCPRCEPDTAESTARPAFSVDATCPRCGGAGELEWRRVFL